MEITLVKKNEKTKRVSYCVTDICKVLSGIKSGKYSIYVNLLREVYAELREDSDYRYYDRIQRVIPAIVNDTKAGKELKYGQYTGFLTLKVDGLSEISLQERIKSEAMLLPQTLATFVAANGHSVIILTQAVLPGLELPKTEDEALLFHTKAYRTAVMCYAPALSRSIAVEESRLDADFLVSVDRQLLQNPDAVPFIIQQPNAIEVKTLMDGRMPENQLVSRGNKHNFVSMHQVFNACLMRVRSQITKETWLKPIAATMAIAQECYESGMPEEETTQHLLWRYFRENAEDVRSTVRAIYDTEQPQPGLNSHMPKKQYATIRLKEFMERRYELRRNVVTNSIEYRTRYSMDFRFHELTKVDRNTIKYEAAMEGIEAFDSEINGFIDSNYTPNYNPIEDYLNTLPQWDGKDRIQQLCDMVPTSNPHWNTLFRRWFLSMVAHWMVIDCEHGNNTAPILVGAQGYRKSTFCRILLPPELRTFFSDSVDFRTKQEAERYLTRFLLINIDEFDQLSENQFAFVKHLFQKPNVSMRRMYSEAISLQRRYASFIGTSNHHEILRDPTGNRRYLCVEVTARIRTEMAIDYSQLYAQVLSLIRQGERYWLDDADEALLRETNQHFETQSPLELILLDTFRPAKEDEPGAQLLKLTDIMTVLSGHQIFNRKTMNNLRSLGRVMSKLGFEYKHKNTGVYYWVKALYSPR